jgi:ribosomal protein L34E
MKPEDEAFEAEWRRWSQEMYRGMQDWRAEHPRASLTAIEQELDRRLSAGRARLLEQVAQQSPAAAWRGREEAPRCPQCGTPLQPRGRKRRQVRTQGGHELMVQREYGVCPQCGQGLFPPG